jgi:glycerol-3-phosphate dehydrogenase subunit B
MTMRTECDLLIVGGGLTGLVAAWRAQRAGLKTVLVAQGAGSLPFTSGALDLLAVYPTETKRYRESPWEALSELVEREPAHPYGRLGLRRVRAAVEEFLPYMEAGPLAYYRRGELNMAIVTGAGTIKPTYAVSASMKNNRLAWNRRRPTLILGFEGFPDFSPEQVVGNLQDRWVGLRAARLDRSVFSGSLRRLTLAHLAAEFERTEFRDRFAGAVKPLLGRSRFLGLPAVLGFESVTDICRDLEEKLGAAVFEIPLLTPSLPGMRMADMLKRDLLAAGVDCRQGAPVGRLDREGKKITAAHRSGKTREEEILAGHVILATGRFFGGGLEAGRQGVREVLLGLPVEAPSDRDNWHMASFLGAPGHPINRVGVKVDPSLRPLGTDGQPLYENLFAAGALLAGHDWVREKSGAGICLATGHAAVESVIAQRCRAVPAGGKP